MKPSSQFRVDIYVVAALVYLSESKKLKKFMPEKIREVFETYHSEILLACYLALVYYYSNVEYH